MKKSGFTLAEVLIVLGIIGIVAEMTIPTLMNNINDAASKAQLKKAYSEFSQTFSMITMDSGGSFKGLCTDADYNCIRDIFAAKMNVIKKCDAGRDVTDGCWVYPQKFANGDNDVNYESRAGLILADGTAVTFYSYYTNCNDLGEMYSKPSCSQIVVDVNGPKKPNTVGKDIFAFHILENVIMPYGSGAPYDDAYSTGKSLVYTGFGKTAQYIMNQN